MDKRIMLWYNSMEFSDERLFMIEIHTWLKCFCISLQSFFGDRVRFVGLQGSYARGEATENSDIDVVVILDELSVEDIRTYGSMLDTLPHREQVCGFLSGENELLHWEPSDLFQFYYDTQPIIGSLDALLPLLNGVAVHRAIRIGVCNIYHACVHNMLYEKSTGILKDLYKSASFVMQGMVFAQTGQYIRSQKDLLGVLAMDD